MKTIGLRVVIKQLYADLIGKDSYRGITQTYAWLANQFGHFSLGFLVAWVLNLFLKDAPTSAISSVLFWLIFESYNVFESVYLKARKNPFVFKPQLGNLVYDTLTDLIYFWLGALIFYLPVRSGDSIFWLLIPFGIYLSIAFWFWYRIKIYLQEGFLPFQFRLSQWRGKFVSPIEKDQIELFNSSTDCLHLLISGPINSGKTSLAIGLASEAALQKKTVFYTTLFRLSGDLALKNDTKSQTGLWTRRSADFLIVDDTNPDGLNWVDLERFGELLQNSGEVPELNSKKVIWILNENDLEAWKSKLKSIGIQTSKTFSCRLK
ncbi:MAG: hypothetical protein L6Q78_15210 [Bacteroidia bacterium]|nr:hypothetical protein [Bacteroidia bacterium]